MIATVKISKVDFNRLERQAKAYRQFVAHMLSMVVRDPIDDVVADFKDANRYSDDFLRDLTVGLRKSSYARTHGHSATARRSSRVRRAT